MNTGYKAALKLNGDISQPQATTAFSFLPGDIILCECSNDWFGRLERWALESRWGHVVIKGRGPLVIESIGRGVVRRNISTCSGRYVQVLRHIDHDAASLAVEHAESIANNTDAYYDYWGLLRYLVPHLLLYKLTGRRWSFGYKHDRHYWCSEFVSAAYSHTLLSPEYEPIEPGEFTLSPLLTTIYEGVCP